VSIRVQREVSRLGPLFGTLAGVFIARKVVALCTLDNVATSQTAA
jgi:hypothetical protein